MSRHTAATLLACAIVFQPFVLLHADTPHAITYAATCLGNELADEACMQNACAPCPHPSSPVLSAASSGATSQHWLMTRLLAALLAAIVLTTLAYGMRHTAFTFSRLMGRQRHPYTDVMTAEWPQITVFIAAHNEEKVIAGCIEALLGTDYPHERLRIVPVNDRSTDATRSIVDLYAARHTDLIVPFHRTSGKPGKAAALKDALAFVRGDIVIVFDADYLPGKSILRRLVAPFFDPEVGAVMGRVVPVNAGTNLLTRLLDLERSAGYQVDQQARMNLRGVPQYGGTVGGVRRSAVESSGGWRDDVLAEDTDITFRLLIAGWKTVYVNRAECYEEVPEEWSVRIRQVSRWAKGHNQVLRRCWRPLLASPFLSLRERIDGAMLLLVFVIPPLLVVGWMIAVLLYYLHAGWLVGLFIPALALAAYGALGNFATFLEIVGGLLLDGHHRRVRLLPLNLLCFVVSLVAITRALGDSVLDAVLHRDLVWHKTLRYRSA